MSRLNKIILIGTLINTPETKATASGDTVSNFTLEVDRPVTETSPDKKDNFKIVCWRDVAEQTQSLTEGSTVLVEGSIRPRSYENNEGQRIYVTEVEARNVQALASQPTATLESNDDIPIIETSESSEAFDFNAAIQEQAPDFNTKIEEDVPF